MSDTFVICRELLPLRLGGWTIEVGPVRIVEHLVSPAFEHAAGFRALHVLEIDGPPRAAKEAAEMLAEVSRGVVLHRGRTDDREDFEPSLNRRLTAQVLEADLHAVVTVAQAARVVEEAPLRPRPSRPDAGANDWSDL